MTWKREFEEQMEVEELPHLGFGPVQMTTFVPLFPIIEEYAEKHQLRLSRVFDGTDLITPHCCYFLIWPRERCRGCFISICSQELFTISTHFNIRASGLTRRHYQQWDYSTEEGQTRLRQILDAAILLVEPEDNPSKIVSDDD